MRVSSDNSDADGLATKVDSITTTVLDSATTSAGAAPGSEAANSVGRSKLASITRNAWRVPSNGWGVLKKSLGSFVEAYLQVVLRACIANDLKASK